MSSIQRKLSPYPEYTNPTEHNLDMFDLLSSSSSPRVVWTRSSTSRIVLRPFRRTLLHYRLRSKLLHPNLHGMSTPSPPSQAVPNAVQKAPPSKKRQVGVEARGSIYFFVAIPLAVIYFEVCHLVWHPTLSTVSSVKLLTSIYRERIRPQFLIPNFLRAGALSSSFFCRHFFPWKSPEMQKKNKFKQWRKLQ